MEKWRNWALVWAGTLDQPIQGKRWQGWVQRLYSLRTDLYDLTIEHLFPDYLRVAEELVQMLEITAVQRVLDLGCGTGMVTLPAMMRARQVVGLDLTMAMLTRLQQKSSHLDKHVPVLVQGDANALPLADSSFDRATTSFMLLHLTNAEKQQALREVARVLVPGGRLGILTGRGEVSRVYPMPLQWQAWLSAAGFDEVEWWDRLGAYRLITAQRAPQNKE